MWHLIRGPGTRAGGLSGTHTRVPAGAKQGDCRFVQARDRMRGSDHDQPSEVEVTLPFLVRGRTA